jgi:hypothetical protein
MVCVTTLADTGKLRLLLCLSTDPGNRGSNLCARI